MAGSSPTPPPGHSRCWCTLLDQKCEPLESGRPAGENGLTSAQDGRAASRWFVSHCQATSSASKGRSKFRAPTFSVTDDSTGYQRLCRQPTRNGLPLRPLVQEMLSPSCKASCALCCRVASHRSRPTAVSGTHKLQTRKPPPIVVDARWFVELRTVLHAAVITRGHSRTYTRAATLTTPAALPSRRIDAASTRLKPSHVPGFSRGASFGALRFGEPGFSRHQRWHVFSR